MIVKSTKDVPVKPVDLEGAEKVTMRMLISEEDGAVNFRMRLFEIEKGGCSPYHAHDYEHEVLILGGKGKLIAKNNQYDLSEGDVAFVVPNEEHQFKNVGEEPLKFICLVPIEKK